MYRHPSTRIISVGERDAKRWRLSATISPYAHTAERRYDHCTTYEAFLEALRTDLDLDSKTPEAAIVRALRGWGLSETGELHKLPEEWLT